MIAKITDNNKQSYIDFFNSIKFGTSEGEVDPDTLPIIFRQTLLLFGRKTLNLAYDDTTIENLQSLLIWYVSHNNDIITKNNAYACFPPDEPTFDIDFTTRKIKVPSTFTKNGIGIEGDAAEVFWFSCPRYFESIDLYDRLINSMYVTVASKFTEAELSNWGQEDGKDYWSKVGNSYIKSHPSEEENPNSEDYYVLNDGVGIFIQSKQGNNNSLIRGLYPHLSADGQNIKFAWAPQMDAAGSITLVIRLLDNIEGNKISINTLEATVPVMPTMTKVDSVDSDAYSNTLAILEQRWNIGKETLVSSAPPRTQSFAASRPRTTLIDVSKVDTEFQLDNNIQSMVLQIPETAIIDPEVELNYQWFKFVNDDYVEMPDEINSTCEVNDFTPGNIYIYKVKVSDGTIDQDIEFIIE